MARLDRAIYTDDSMAPCRRCRYLDRGLDRPIKGGDDGGRKGRAMKRVFTCLFLALSVAILPGRADAGVVTSYSLVAHDPVNDTTVLLVRAVVDGAGADCPAFVVNGADAPVSKRQNPDADQFPVTVCEAKAPLDATVTVDGTSVPTMAGHDGGALDLAIFGDSGCSPSHQNCTTGWPYPELIAAAVEQQPDLVIHVGDYDYRGTPSRT